jgi:hypothetical protein
MFLAFEPMLVARIEATIKTPGLKVLTAADLAGVSAQAQHAPAVQVIFDGWRLAEANGLTTVTERWLTVVAVRNARSQITGFDTRGNAAPILDALFAALNGWQAEIDGRRVKPLRPVTPPRPGFDAGFGYYPLAWEAHLPDQVAPCPTY